MSSENEMTPENPSEAPRPLSAEVDRETLESPDLADCGPDEIRALAKVLCIVGAFGGRASKKSVFDKILLEDLDELARDTAEDFLVGHLVEGKAVRVDGEDLVLESPGTITLALFAEKHLDDELAKTKPGRPSCPRCRSKAGRISQTALFLPGVGASPVLRAFPIQATLGCSACRKRLAFPERVYGVPFPEESTDGKRASGPLIVAALRAEADRLEALFKS